MPKTRTAAPAAPRDDFEAQDDFRTMTRAEEVRADKRRLSAARRVGKRQLSATKRAMGGEKRG